MAQVVDLRKNLDKKTSKKQKSQILKKLEWTAPEFTKYKKNKSWFIWLIFFALVIIIIAIIFKNFLWVVLTILAVFTIYIYATKEPRKIKFSISGKGIQIDQKIYKFENLKSFWIFYDPPEVKEISLRSKKVLMPYIKIPLGDQNPVEIRKLLLNFLPEKKHKESIIDEWARKIRF